MLELVPSGQVQVAVWVGNRSLLAGALVDESKFIAEDQYLCQLFKSIQRLCFVFGERSAEVVLRVALVAWPVWSRGVQGCCPFKRVKRTVVSSGCNKFKGLARLKLDVVRSVRLFCVQLRCLVDDFTVGVDGENDTITLAAAMAHLSLQVHGFVSRCSVATHGAKCWIAGGVAAAFSQVCVAVRKVRGKFFGCLPAIVTEKLKGMEAGNRSTLFQ